MIEQLYKFGDNVGTSPKTVQFTLTRSIDDYDFIIINGKTNEWKRDTAILTKDNAYKSQYFALTAYVSTDSGNTMFRRVTEYKIETISDGFIVSLVPKWSTDFHITGSQVEFMGNSGIAISEVYGIIAG